MKNKKLHLGLNSISSKIAISIIVLNLLILTTVTVIVGLIVQDNVGSQSENNAKTEVSRYANQFDKKFKEVEGVVNALATSMASTTDVERLKNDDAYLETFEQEYINILKNMGEGLGLTNSIYVYYNAAFFNKEIDMWVYDDGSGFSHMSSLGDVESYETTGAWYTDPIVNGTTQWSFPYAAAETNELITSFTTPIISDGQIIGLAGMDVPLTDISATLNEITLYETGYLYLIAPNGDIIEHSRIPWVDGTTKNMNDVGDFQWLIQDMSENQSNFTSYIRDDGQKVVAAYDHLENGWVLGSSIPQKEVYAIINLIVTLLIIITVIAVLIALVVSIFIGKSISKPILDIVYVTEKIKDGDFTNRVQSKAKDETKILSNSINEMSENICVLISKSKEVAKEMLDSASNLASMAEETNATVEQVATTVDDIAKGTNETAQEAEKSARVVSVIDEKFASLLVNSNVMQDNAETALNMNKEGLEALERLELKSEESKLANVKVAHAVQELDMKAGAITNIIATISQIASQTNLLALNASIEAARAGEAGRGFAVVAEEIRKLAEDSSKATDEISNIVSAIQKESKDTVDVMNEVQEITTEQNVVVSTVNNALSRIFDSVDNIAAQIKLVVHSVDDLNIQKNEIVEITNTISAVSEETAAGTEEVNASMEEQSKVVEEVAMNAEKLNSLALELNENIEIFKV